MFFPNCWPGPSTSMVKTCVGQVYKILDPTFPIFQQIASIDWIPTCPIQTPLCATEVLLEVSSSERKRKTSITSELFSIFRLYKLCNELNVIEAKLKVLVQLTSLFSHHVLPFLYSCFVWFFLVFSSFIMTTSFILIFSCTLYKKTREKSNQGLYVLLHYLHRLCKSR